jgi:hypothetical protein
MFNPPEADKCLLAYGEFDVYVVSYKPGRRPKNRSD